MDDYAWSWADVQRLGELPQFSDLDATDGFGDRAVTPVRSTPDALQRPHRNAPIHGGAATWASGGGLTRFSHHGRHSDRAMAALASSHPALREGRSLFARSVVDPAKSPRLLVSGMNNAKLGRAVMRGPWRGLPIYHLTLEERATCPTSCAVWAECFGNAMPFARRHVHGSDLEHALHTELAVRHRRHRQGFAVRLHTLGDFYDIEYVRTWMRWMAGLPGLRVFGFTAHPADSEIGRLLERANQAWPDRWVIRFSVAPEALHAPHQATTIWRQPDGPTVAEGTVCPAQTGGTAACATCGLCWAPAAAGKRIVFIGHGMRKRNSGLAPTPNPILARDIAGNRRTAS